MGALADYVKKKWGFAVHSRENPVTAVVGAGVTRILNNNADRLGAIIVNYDAVLMRVAPSRSVSATYGLPLDPSGGFIALEAEADGEMVGYEWFVYSDAGGTIYILETEAG